MIAFHLILAVLSSYLFSTEHKYSLAHAMVTPPSVARPSPAHIELVSRKIKKTQSVQEAMDILETESAGLNHDPVEAWYAQAISVCGKAKDVTTALKLMRQIPDSDLCRARAISICGVHGKVEDVLALLQEKPLTSTAPYNAAVAACGNHNNWQGILSILHDYMPKELVTSLTINAALTGFSKARRGNEALQMLNEAKLRWNVEPDRVSFHNTLSALLRDNQLEEACKLVHRMKDSKNPSISPTQETYNRIASAVSGKERERASVVALLGDAIVGDAKQGELDFFQQWDLPKNGKGKSSYWSLGELTIPGEPLPITVGLQPNRNPAANGMKICFFRKKSKNEDDNKEQKIGFLLMINSSTNVSSKFLGQFLEESERGKGWAKMWFAVWLQLCLDAGIRPYTGKIHKPLLCLVLQHSFGMIPKKGGVDVELSPGDKPGHVILYSESRSLEGAFSPMVRRKQNIKLSSVPLKPRGRQVVVSSSFDSPPEANLRDKVSVVLKSHLKLNEGIKDSDLKDILLGQ